jgi:hypothetical protein
MRDVPPAGRYGTSLEVRIAAGLVGAGALLGVLLVVGAGFLLANDPGFLFAVLPAIAGGAIVAGVYIAGTSIQLTRRLLRRAPGARLTAAVFGAVICVAGLFALSLEPLLGAVVAVYGAVLLWLMTTSAAAQDLGSWFEPPGARAQRVVPAWLPRSMRPVPRPVVPSPPTSAPPPTFTAAGPRPSRQRPDTWIELWQEGLTRIPVLDLIALVVGLVGFVVGDVLVFVALVGSRDGALLLGLALVGVAIGIHVVLERRMLARLGYT